MFSRLMVALVRNCEPFLPPDGSGLFGFDDAFDLVKAEPFFPEAALAAMYLWLRVWYYAFRFDSVFLTI